MSSCRSIVVAMAGTGFLTFLAVMLVGLRLLAMARRGCTSSSSSFAASQSILSGFQPAQGWAELLVSSSNESIFMDIGSELPDRIAQEEISLQTAEVLIISNCRIDLEVGAIVGLMNRHGPLADCSDEWAKILGLKTRKVNKKELLQRAQEMGLFNGTVAYESGNPISENLAISTAGIFNLRPVVKSDIESEKPTFDFSAGASQGKRGGDFKTHSEATKWSIENLLDYSHDKKFVYRPPGKKLTPFIAMERVVAVFVDDIEKKCTEYNLAPFQSLAEFIAKKNGLKPFLDLTSSSHWDTSERPLSMFGYSAGIYESTGFCTRKKTMGVVASDMADSISLILAYQRAHPEVEVSMENPLKQNPVSKEEAQLRYDKDEIYVTHIVSDGDNIKLLDSTFSNLVERREACAVMQSEEPCSPRAWTVSGQTETVSGPLRRMYNVSDWNRGADSFILPPSGASYFYPAAAVDYHGLMQQRDWTLKTAAKMDIQATIIWDFFFHFFASQHRDYVKSFIGTQIKAVFWSAAPWLLSPDEEDPFAKLGYKSDQVYRDEHNRSSGVVVFSELTRWGALTNEDTRDGKGFTIEKMAEVVMKQPKGSLNFVYDISWGVGPHSFESYARYLRENAPNVHLVDHRTLIRLACEKHGLVC